MFQKGQYVNYGKHGVCLVEDITHMDIPGVDKNKLYSRKQECIANGKKVAVSDERFFREAEDHLYGELALSLGIGKEDVEQFICKKVEEIQKDYLNCYQKEH